MRFLFYWRTKQKIRETRLERCAAREAQYAALHLLTLFCPKSGAYRNIGGNVTRIACGNAEKKKRYLSEHRGAMPRRSLVGTLKEKAVLVGTSVAMPRRSLSGSTKEKAAFAGMFGKMQRCRFAEKCGMRVAK